MIQINIYRELYTNNQVMGTCIVRKNGHFENAFVTLEKPWLNNQKSKSCIPSGNYELEHWNSEKHPNSFHVKNVKDRTYILIHKGNYHYHSEGCILLGGMFEDINNDGLKDILYSTKAMELLNEICKDETDIKLIIA